MIKIETNLKKIQSKKTISIIMACSPILSLFVYFIMAIFALISFVLFIGGEGGWLGAFSIGSAIVGYPMLVVLLSAIGFFVSLGIRNTGTGKVCAIINGIELFLAMVMLFYSFVVLLNVFL